MRKLLLFIAVFLCSFGISFSYAQHTSYDYIKGSAQAGSYYDEQGHLLDTLSSVSRQVADSLQQLVLNYQHQLSALSSSVYQTKVSPYFFQILAPGTYYSNPVRRSFLPQWGQNAFSPVSLTGYQPSFLHLVPGEVISDAELVRLARAYDSMSSMYVNYPTLITVTEDELEEIGKVMKDVDTPIKSETMLHEEVLLTDFDDEHVDAVEAILRRPNFWKLKGSNSLDITQNYATRNWFQGKANHYNVLGIVTLEANYDNKRKIQWDNRLDLQLGFQTISDDEYKKYKPTNNLVRLNTKLGIKAAKNWFYTFNIKGETQLVPNYNYDKEGHRTCINDVLSPLNVDFSLGIDWKWNLKRFTGSFYLAPGTYNLKFVDRIELATRYGIEKDHHVKHSFGPSSTIRFNWKIADNISWDSRLYWITNLHYTNVEYENTVTFTVNKYLTSKIYFYPRFNDQSPKNRMPHKDGKADPEGSFWMFKEWLSMGVRYSW